jgi:hypothetical protein
MVDWAALGQVIVYAFAATVTVVLLFTSGVLLTSGQRSGPRVATGGLAFAACAVLVAVGLYVMLTTK